MAKGSCGIAEVVGAIALFSYLMPYSWFNKTDPAFSCFTPFYSTFVWSSIKIHESHFGSWAKLDEALKLEPSRITIVDSIVQIKGPVWIIPSTGMQWFWKFFIPTCAATVASEITMSLACQISPAKNPDSNNPEDTYFTGFAGLIAGGAAAYFTWKQVSKIIPVTRGIFFY